MRIYYRNQLPGKQPREFHFGGIIGTLLSILIGAAILAFLIFFVFPFAILAIVSFIALVIFGLVVGWIWLGFKIGWRNLWDFTKIFCSIAFGRSTFSSKSDQFRSAWSNYTKGRPGEWR